MNNSTPVDRRIIRTAVHPEFRLPVRATVGIAVLLIAVCGCKQEADPSGDPPAFNSDAGEMPESLKTIQVTSPAFEEGGAVPVRHTCEGIDISPPLEWSGAPETARALVVTCLAPDAPEGSFAHWLCYTGDRSQTSLPEDAQRQPEVDSTWILGENDFATIGYRGPCPPAGPPHRYQFQVIAFDRPLNLRGSASFDDVLLEIETGVMAWGQLTATFGADGIE